METAALIISKPPHGPFLVVKYHLPADGFFYIPFGRIEQPIF